MSFESSHALSEVGQVILNLLLGQLPETRSLGAFHAFVAKQVVGWRAHDA